MAEIDKKSPSEDVCTPHGTPGTDELLAHVARGSLCIGEGR